MGNMIRHTIGFILLTLSAVGPLSAQGGKAALEGAVVDSTDSVLVGADVFLRNVGSGLEIHQVISESELDNTVNWYFSLDNLHAANDRVLRFLDQLPLPNLYRGDLQRLHTSSDGQKYEVSVDSLNANYSFKYFGQGRGVSSYNFIDERHFLFYSTVISSSEREASYVIDGLLHNEVVKSDIHSTDTHGYTEILFGVMHLLGFTYAPRILSGHFKTGQRWSLQNRPTGMARDGVVLPLWDWTRQARFSPPTPRAAFEDVAVMEQPVQHGCDGGAITQ